FGFQLRRPELELRAVTPAKRRLEPRALAPGPQCCRTEPEQQEQHPATDEQPERVRPSRARRGLRPGAEDLREVLAGDLEGQPAAEIGRASCRERGEISER